jgi:hypothetical protein|tara:strand:- start:1581 stop:1712 length:132 start_codon:yes stop_codon:yes gene_type:complete
MVVKASNDGAMIFFMVCDLPRSEVAFPDFRIEIFPHHTVPLPR